MNKTDRDLGMDREIARRDFLNGVSLAVGGAALGPSLVEAAAAAERGPSGGADPATYPPARTGLRGSNNAAYEVAHQMRDGQRWETSEDTRETYDLVVVGAGMSGLAAAAFYRKMNYGNPRILILDNHDDFGGHARRNEFTVNGRLLISKGGTSYIAKPWTFTSEGRDLLNDIGVDYYEPTAKRDTNRYSAMGLRRATYFDRESFGKDAMVKADSAPSSGTRGGSAPSAEFLAQSPLPPQVQQELLRLYTDKRDYFEGMSKDEVVKKLKTTSFQDYLLNIVKVHPDVLKYYHPDGPAGLTTDTTSAWYFFNRGHPGFGGLGLQLAVDAPAELDRNRPDPKEPTEFHFPEGNAGLARLLVRSLIPAALPGRNMVDAETTRVNYARLDEASSPVRIRLSSTVVRARNIGDPATATEVEVTYVKDGRAQRVRAKGCVLACYHAVIPYLCPELPQDQLTALRMQVRGVNMTTSVAVRDWKAFERMGISGVSCPGLQYPGYSGVTLQDSISLGGYQAPSRPDEPIVLTLNGGIPRLPGIRPREQFRETRRALYQISFEDFERKMRTHLARVLGEGGFDPARDIAAITVSRWGHGYAMGANMFDPVDWTPDQTPWVRARKPFGRITIANSEAGAVHLTNAAWDQAYRAVDELNPRHMGWWQRH